MRPYRATPRTGTHKQNMQICQVTSAEVLRGSTLSTGQPRLTGILDLYPPAQCAPRSLDAFNCEAIQNNLAFPGWGQQGPWVPFFDLTFPLWEFHLGTAMPTAVFTVIFCLKSAVWCVPAHPLMDLICMLHQRLTWTASQTSNWPWTNGSKRINTWRVRGNSYSLLYRVEVVWLKSPVFFLGFFLWVYAEMIPWVGTEWILTPNGHRGSYETFEDLHMPGLNIPQYYKYVRLSWKYMRP